MGRSHVLSVMVSARWRWRLCRNRRLALIAAHTLSLHRTKGRPSKLFQSAPQQIIFTGRGQGWPFYSPHVWLSHKSTHTHLHRQGVLQVVPKLSTHTEHKSKTQTITQSLTHTTHTHNNVQMCTLPCRDAKQPLGDVSKWQAGQNLG